jgi:hypothetical protein
MFDIGRGLRSGFALALAIGGLAASAVAQSPPPPASAPAAQDQVVVTGRSEEDAIRDFVGGISAPTSKGENQLARWDRRVCPGLVGLRPELARQFVDRIAYRAVSVGLGVGKPGCRSNILIIVSLKPDEVAKELYDTSGSAMGRKPGRGVRTRGEKALDAFLASDAPVRWWHVSHTVTRDGESLAGDSSDGSAPVARLTGGSSLISRMTRQDFAAAFVVVDAGQMQKIDFNALADYIAMVSLAQLDPEADATGVPSILNLFAGRNDESPPLTSMTDWDLAYLKGLYSMEREAKNSARQEGDIARTIEKELRKDAPAPADQ